MKKETNQSEHLPLYGVGSLITFGQVGITVFAILLSYHLQWDFGRISVLRIPFGILGIVLIFLGGCLYFSAVKKSKLFENIENNNLVTDGVYGIVRNPVYSCILLACTGAILIVNNLILLIVPVICWIYMSVFLINTEEKWLLNLYGQEYTDYCKKVNRCIPWFPKK